MVTKGEESQEHDSGKVGVGGGRGRREEGKQARDTVPRGGMEGRREWRAGGFG